MYSTYSGLFITIKPATMNLNEIFTRLWNGYITQNPSAKRIHDLFADQGEQVVNDHIAFRTFNDPRVNIDVLSEIFRKNGYEEMGSYDFKQKKLDARHFELPNDPNAPRVFISELRLQEFPDAVKQIVQEFLDNIPVKLLQSDKLIFSGNCWGLPEFATYQELLKHSEYAAWMYVYGFRANHFTVSVNGLKKFKSLEEVNQFLKDNGFILNTSGGEIKGTPTEMLQQSSTMAEVVPVIFKEGTYQIPACYYEFAKRFKDSNGNLYNGFIAKSADKIFESTDLKK